MFSNKYPNLLGANSPVAKGHTNGDARFDLYDKIAAGGDAFRQRVLDRLDVGALAIVAASIVLAIHVGNNKSLAWLWAVLASAAVILAVYERNRSSEPYRVQATASAAQDLFDHAKKNTTGVVNDDKYVLHPHLFSVARVKGNPQWLRGDPNLIAALNTLRPYSIHDSARVRYVLEFLGEFYKRYDRMLNRPFDVNLRHEYTILHDIHLKTLNVIHELYLTQNIVLTANLEVVLRTVHARTFRMLRVLRHKYPDALRAVKEEKGSAPRSFDPAWTSYDLYV